jgi:hypothetical protein
VNLLYDFPSQKVGDGGDIRERAEVTTAENPRHHPPPLKDAIDKYEAWQLEYSKRQDAENKITLPLYHYTNAEGLRGIFESKQIWFTDYRHLNDPSEFLHGLEFARDIAGQLKESADSRAKFFLDQFITRFRSETFDKGFEFYIASFSRKRNDLGQWRAYADNGQGFAIGFAPPLFEILQNLPADKPPDFVSAVKYTRTLDVSALYTPPIRKATELFLSAAMTNADLIENEAIGITFFDEMINRLISALILTAVTTKHSAYDHEEEVRLVIADSATKLLPFVKTRLRGSEMIPYIPQPWPVQEPGNVVEIVVGPAAPPDTERTLRKFLSSLGMDFENIRRSDIPYRALSPRLDTSLR